MKVVAFVEGVSKHSLGHGSLLLKKLMMSSKMAAARDALPGVTHKAASASTRATSNSK